MTINSDASTNTPGWELRFEELRAFQLAFGHLHVPQTPVRSPLYNWTNTQRTAYHAGTLSSERIAALESLGFHWGRSKNSWEQWVERYQRFHAAHSRGDVAYIKNHDKDLSTWVNRQKGALARGQLTPAQAQQLEVLGLQPAVRTTRRKNADVKLGREATLTELAEFVQQHGHAHLPPSKDPDSLCLRVRTIKHKATHRADGPLLEKLSRLGVFRRYPDAAWEAAFSEWKAYAHATGDFSCEAGAVERLTQWVRQTRSVVSRCGDRRLAVPLASRYADWPAPAVRRGILDAVPRLQTAGFDFEPATLLTEADLLAQRVQQIVGLPRELRLTLRTTLRVLTHRSEAGTLSLDCQAQLLQLGFKYLPSSRAWTYPGNGFRMRGAVVTTLPPLAIEVGPMEVTPALPLARGRGRPKKVDSWLLTTKAVQAKDLPLMRAVKWQFYIGSPPRSEADLLVVDEIARCLTPDDTGRQQAELRRALTRLVELEWLLPVPGRWDSAEAKMYQRAPAQHRTRKPVEQPEAHLPAPASLREAEPAPASTIPDVEQWRQTAPLRYGNIPLLYAVKRQFEFGGPALTEKYLLQLRAVSGYCLPGAEAQHRAELRVALAILVDLKWLQYAPGDFGSEELRPLQRSAPVLFG